LSGRRLKKTDQDRYHERTVSPQIVGRTPGAFQPDFVRPGTAQNQSYAS
jgi:hypothetical protein